ncbi:MAG: DUF4825 domain-containing protein [Clostridium sp.]|nr:DUF4825 domain-containing protein [Clostridium sp.]
MLRDIFSISLSMSAVIAALIIVSPFLNKRYTARWRYFVWLILAVRLIIPFNISLPKAPINIKPPMQTVVFKQHEDVPKPLPAAITDGNYIEMGNRSSVPADYAPVITVEKLLGIVWFIGFIIFLVYHFVGYLMFRRKIKPWCRVQIEGRPQVLICKKVVSPMLTGFLKPIILLPNIEYSTKDLEVILAHETAHYRRGDLWYKLLMLLANAMHWFNPLVYAMAHFASRDIELSCDDMVVKNKDLKFRKAYSNTILNTLHSGTSTSLSTHFKGGKKTMKKRFSNILDMQSKKKGILAFTVIFIVMTIAGMFVACNSPDASIIGSSDDTTSIFVANSDRINELYGLKGTFVGNNSEVVKIIDLSPHGGFERGEVKLFTDKTPYGIEVNYKQLDKYKGDMEILKTAAILFALVDNAEFVKYHIKIDDGSVVDIESDRQSVTTYFQNSFDYAYVTRTKKDFEKFYNDLTAYRSPYDIDTSQISTSTYTQTMNYIYNKIVKENSKHYVMLGFETTNYEEELNGDDFIATFCLKQNFKNFYKDPDTVDYIKELKENGSSSYKILCDEYNEPQEANYDIKVTAKMFPQGTKLDEKTYRVYYNQSPKGPPEWKMIEELFPDSEGETKKFTHNGLVYEISNVKSVEVWHYPKEVSEEKDKVLDITVAPGAQLLIIDFEEGWGLYYSETDQNKNIPITSDMETIVITNDLKGIYHRESSLFATRFIIE